MRNILLNYFWSIFPRLSAWAAVNHLIGPVGFFTLTPLGYCSHILSFQDFKSWWYPMHLIFFPLPSGNHVLHRRLRYDQNPAYLHVLPPGKKPGCTGETDHERLTICCHLATRSGTPPSPSCRTWIKSSARVCGTTLLWRCKLMNKYILIIPFAPPPPHNAPSKEKKLYNHNWISTTVPLGNSLFFNFSIKIDTGFSPRCR